MIAARPTTPAGPPGRREALRFLAFLVAGVVTLAASRVPPAAANGMDAGEIDRVAAEGDGAWQAFPPPNPIDLAVVDPVRDRVLTLSWACGGANPDVWSFDLGLVRGWQRVPTGGILPFRGGATLVYDPLRDRLLVFGGFDTNEVWALPLTGRAVWGRILVSGTTPHGRRGHGAVYDPLRDRLVIFGGYYVQPVEVPLRDAWALSLSGTPAWTPIVPADTLTATPIGMAAVYDRESDRLIAMGGRLGEPWALGLGAAPSWRRIVTSSPAPAVSTPPLLTYDPGGRRVLVSAGDQLWTLSLADPPDWTRSTIGGLFPLFPRFSAAVYDSTRGSIVLAGASGTGVLTTSAAPTWTEISSFPRWRPMQWASAVYDSRRDRMIVVGQGDRTFALPLEGPPVWTPIADQIPFGSLRGHGTIYDPRRDRVVVVGGERSGTPLDQVWVLPLDGGGWSPLETGGTPPPPRLDVSAIYDPIGDRLLLYGGVDPLNTTATNETWALSLAPPATWTQLSAATPPSGRRQPSVVYDPLRHRMLMFGGGAIRLRPGGDDLWALALDGAPRWERIAFTGDPPPGRESACAVYDPVRDRLVLYSGVFLLQPGQTTYGHRTDAIAITLGETPTCTRLAPLDGSPYPRWGAPTIYDPERDRMVFFSGDSLTDTWALSWNRPRRPALSCPARIEWTPGERARFACRVVNPQPFAQPFTFELTSARDWPDVARAGAGEVAASDSVELPFALDVPDSAAGGRNTIAVTVTLNSVAQSVHAEASIDVPFPPDPPGPPGPPPKVVPAALTLAGLQPNPARGEFALAFTLADDSPARLELIDVNGRRVLDQDVGLGAGPHTLAAPQLATLRAGLYFIRLTQRGRSIVRRGVVAR